MQTRVVNIAAAESLGPPPAGTLSIPIFAHGSLDVRLYSPPGEDQQQPHERDEAYVVARGQAVFCDPAGQYPLSTGAFVFVAAGVAHRFVSMSADFAVWVVFYGPAGGESDTQ